MAQRAKGTKRKRTPQRMCIACRQPEGKRALIRLVRTETGVELDRTGKKPGRGAYIHPLESCWERLVGSSLLQRALRTQIHPEVLQSLTEAVSDLLEPEGNANVDTDTGDIDSDEIESAQLLKAVRK